MPDKKLIIHKPRSLGPTTLMVDMPRQPGKTTLMKQDAHKRLENISQQIKAMDKAQHTEVLKALLGGLKGAASFDPMGVVPAISAMEIVMEGFISES